MIVQFNINVEKFLSILIQEDITVFLVNSNHFFLFFYLFSVTLIN